jgi:Peptidase A4 family
MGRFSLLISSALRDVVGSTRRHFVTLSLGAALAVVASIAGSADSAAVATLTHGRPVQLVSAASRGAVQSTNWSGYAAYQSSTTFTDVKANWTQPSVTCPKHGTQYASFWVGLDGYNSNSVEQIGTDSDCSRGSGRYYAWFEMYPAAPVNLAMAVHAGDTISVAASAPGSTFTLTASNLTTGATFTTQQTSSSAARTSVEWVAEAPSSCFITCSVLPLANFGTVNFQGSYTTGNGHTGSISDTGWTDDSITMVTSSGTIKASPSALSPDGTTFSDTWHHQ